MNCMCGHSWMDHAAGGRGGCVAAGCECQRFTKPDPAMIGFSGGPTPVWSAAPKAPMPEVPEVPDGISTLEEARAYVEERLDEGVLCPCCCRRVQRYRTAMNKRHGKILACLYAAGTWVHVDDMPHRDVAFIRHWGLVKEKPKEEGSRKKTSGYWTLTEAGANFVARRIRVPSHAVTLRGALLYLDGDPITHGDVLPRDFDFNELMAERLSTRPPGMGVDNTVPPRYPCCGRMPFWTSPPIPSSRTAPSSGCRSPTCLTPH